eukprot:7384202-Prymnesium_polylepis.3
MAMHSSQSPGIQYAKCVRSSQSPGRQTKGHPESEERRGERTCQSMPAFMRAYAPSIVCTARVDAGATREPQAERAHV